jgi:hypothetical protein
VLEPGEPVDVVLVELVWVPAAIVPEPESGGFEQLTAMSERPMHWAM